MKTRSQLLAAYTSGIQTQFLHLLFLCSLEWLWVWPRQHGREGRQMVRTRGPVLGYFYLPIWLQHVFYLKISPFKLWCEHALLVRSFEKVTLIISVCACMYGKGRVLQSVCSSEDKLVVLAFSFHCYMASRNLTQDIVGLPTLPTKSSPWLLARSKFIKFHFTNETYIKMQYQFVIVLATSKEIKKRKKRGSKSKLCDFRAHAPNC